MTKIGEKFKSINNLSTSRTAERNARSQKIIDFYLQKLQSNGQ